MLLVDRGTSTGYVSCEVAENKYEKIEQISMMGGCFVLTICAKMSVTMILRRACAFSCLFVLDLAGQHSTALNRLIDQRAFKAAVKKESSSVTLQVLCFVEVWNCPIPSKPDKILYLVESSCVHREANIPTAEQILVVRPCAQMLHL